MLMRKKKGATGTQRPDGCPSDNTYLPTYVPPSGWVLNTRPECEPNSSLCGLLCVWVLRHLCRTARTSTLQLDFGVEMPYYVSWVLNTRPILKRPLGVRSKPLFDWRHRHPAPRQRPDGCPSLRNS